MVRKIVLMLVVAAGAALGGATPASAHCFVDFGTCDGHCAVNGPGSYCEPDDHCTINIGFCNG